MAKADRVAVRPFGKNARVGGNVTRSTRRLKSYPPPFFFFFLQKPSLVPVTGGAVLLRPRGRDGPLFQADVARSAGALDHFFFPSRSPLLSPSPGAPYI